jgi:hypothetical protein
LQPNPSWTVCKTLDAVALIPPPARRPVQKRLNKNCSRSLTGSASGWNAGGRLCWTPMKPHSVPWLLIRSNLRARHAGIEVMAVAEPLTCVVSDLPTPKTFVRGSPRWRVRARRRGTDRAGTDSCRTAKTGTVVRNCRTAEWNAQRRSSPAKNGVSKGCTMKASPNIGLSLRGAPPKAGDGR